MAIEMGLGGRRSSLLQFAARSVLEQCRPGPKHPRSFAKVQLQAQEVSMYEAGYLYEYAQFVSVSSCELLQIASPGAGGGCAYE